MTQIAFDRAVMVFPTLSPQHYRKGIEETLGPVAKLIAALKEDPAKLAAFRAEMEGFVARHLEDNVIRQHFLMTRATKR